MKDEITYLDSASTTKVDQRVLQEMLPYFIQIYGNASSDHGFGIVAKEAMEKARIQVADIINCNSQEVVFTSGATESINFAIKGYVEANTEKGNHIITVKTEHKAVLSTCEYLETKGYEVTYLDVDENGLISMSQLRDSIKENTLLVVIMYVNNETGVIQPIREIGKCTRDYNISFLCDATQAIGKVKVDVNEESIDMLCFSAHKLNGPKGVGVLYKREGIELTPLVHGGGQQNGLRGGTYNTPLIAGLAKACEISRIEMNENIIKLRGLNKYLLESIRNITPFKEISKEHFRIPNIINLIIPDLETDIFIGKFKQVAVSNGSACNSEIIEESHVIKALFPNSNLKNNFIRISFDKYSTKKDIDMLVETLRNSLTPKYA